jgi:ribosomal protein S18 acetylase RimI-like enzyme
MSAIRLRPLREDEFPAWHARSRERYAADMVANAGLTPAQADAKAARDGVALLPDGLATPGHHLFVVEDAETGAAVGTLWFALGSSSEGTARAWLYEIEIDAAQRGRGYGRAAMHELEARVRALGHDRIELNVFGGNAVARGLYRSLGYVETAVTMAKPLTD